MSEWKAKRFWTNASIVAREGGFGVELDGRTVRTPGKRPLTLPTQAMAAAVAAEWQAQEKAIDPTTMPVTRTANAAIDKVAVQHDEVADMLAAYGDADLLCYRAEAPAELVARQAELWDPLLDWARDALGAELAIRTGVIHAPQDAATLARLQQKVRQMSDFELAAFYDLVSLSGSLIIGFAAAEGAREAEDLWDISRLDEAWQAEQWGQDDDAEAVAALKKQSFLHAKRMFSLASAQ
ncbi:ATP12 family chaperone protein [Sulfitobacter aestuarii]|uniref:ATP12 family chaperone protein n=1 Tax=Sulfitobacter aestuarii TaxID=2161676 RepID=A0ABW5TYJ8_9RHOB